MEDSGIEMNCNITFLNEISFHKFKENWLQPVRFTTLNLAIGLLTLVMRHKGGIKNIVNIARRWSYIGRLEGQFLLSYL